MPFPGAVYELPNMTVELPQVLFNAPVSLPNFAVGVQLWSGVGVTVIVLVDVGIAVPVELFTGVDVGVPVAGGHIFAKTYMLTRLYVPFELPSVAGNIP